MTKCFLRNRCLFFALLFGCSAYLNSAAGQASYQVHRAGKPIPVDGRWDKKEWKKIPGVKIADPMGKEPAFTPVTEAKLAYDRENLYLIFKVSDRFVKSTITRYNGNVSGDSCVEFFFSPDEKQPLHYFNLEINAGGTPLIFYVTKPWTDFTELDSLSINKIEIAHSLPSVVDPEITEPTEWTIECRIPYAMLKKFSDVTIPEPGARWRANFYKTGSRTSNPHWFTWAHVDFPKPNFHLPQFFGTLEFK